MGTEVRVVSLFYSSHLLEYILCSGIIYFSLPYLPCTTSAVIAVYNICLHCRVPFLPCTISPHAFYNCRHLLSTTPGYLHAFPSLTTRLRPIFHPFSTISFIFHSFSTFLTCFRTSTRALDPLHPLLNLTTCSQPHSTHFSAVSAVFSCFHPPHTMSDYYDDISHYIYGKPMCYEDLLDEELAKTRKTLKTIWEIKHVIVVIGQPKPRFDKIIPLLEYIETILQQRTECDVEDEIVENCSDNGEDNDDLEDDTPLDIIPDIILPSLPIPDAPPPPLSQLPPLLSCFPITTTTTSPPDIIAPQPFPPSPNISSQLSQPRLHLPHHHHPPDTVAPPPLPLKLNIVSTRFTFV